ncbi:MAG: hypothetical protein MI919_17875, partial [Holophagales bacterium]|nr:hypothetical protein [Holophagales bacterium]
MIELKPERRVGATAALPPEALPAVEAPATDEGSLGFRAGRSPALSRPVSLTAEAAGDDAGGADPTSASGPGPTGEPSGGGAMPVSEGSPAEPLIGASALPSTRPSATLVTPTAGSGVESGASESTAAAGTSGSRAR